MLQICPNWYIIVIKCRTMEFTAKQTQRNRLVTSSSLCRKLKIVSRGGGLRARARGLLLPSATETEPWFLLVRAGNHRELRAHAGTFRRGRAAGRPSRPSVALVVYLKDSPCQERPGLLLRWRFASPRFRPRPVLLPESSRVPFGAARAVSPGRIIRNIYEIF